MPHTLTVDFGNGIVAGTGTNIGIIDYDGLASLPTKARVVENALRDGGYIAAIRAGVRRLTFDLDFGDTGLGWGVVPRLFPQGATFEITVTRDGVTRMVTAVRDAELSPLGNRGANDPVAYQIPLVAVGSYLRGEDAISQSASTVTGGLEYPLTFEPTIMYESIDTGESSVTLDVENEGDHPVGFVFTFTAAATVSPTITVDGETMTLDEVTEGQTLVVDTTRQTIRLDGANAFSLLVSGPFLKLACGACPVHLTGMIGVCVLEFTPVYEAV